MYLILIANKTNKQTNKQKIAEYIGTVCKWNGTTKLSFKISEYLCFSIIFHSFTMMQFLTAFPLIVTVLSVTVNHYVTSTFLSVATRKDLNIREMDDVGLESQLQVSRILPLPTKTSIAAVSCGRPRSIKFSTLKWTMNSFWNITRLNCDLEQQQHRRIPSLGCDVVWLL
jgi:hypothetical protein